LKVLLVADEFFSWGRYGGFGAFTRKLGGELVRREVEVDAVVHRISSEQKPVGEVEVIDGVHVKTLPRGELGKLKQAGLYVSDADVIHSQCGMLDTYLAFRRNEQHGKVVTVQDLRTKEDMKQIGSSENMGFAKRLSWHLTLNFYSRALGMADRVFVQAEMLVPKVRSMFGFKGEVGVLPNFVDVPAHVAKSGFPSVVWLGRLDPIKRPCLCFELARGVPDVEFYVLGKAHGGGVDYAGQYGAVKNLHFLGFQDGLAKETVLSKAWVLINTSVYECLPVSFLEALAHKCALLSTQNPDGITERFGVCAKPTVESLLEGLKCLIYADNWKHLGQEGYEYVLKVHETSKCIQDHIDLYRSLAE
jgi:glycosyltransferase involved in cell wall biosynthesis